MLYLPLNTYTHPPYLPILYTINLHLSLSLSLSLSGVPYIIGTHLPMFISFLTLHLCIISLSRSYIELSIYLSYTHSPTCFEMKFAAAAAQNI